MYYGHKKDRSDLSPVVDGGAYGARTRDLYAASVALSQLS